MLWVHDCCSCICIFHDKKGAVFAFLRRFAAPSSSSLSLSPPSRQHTSHTQPLSAVLAAAAAAAARAAATKGHDDPRRYGAQTSNLWSTRVLGVRLLLRGVCRSQRHSPSTRRLYRRLRRRRRQGRRRSAAGFHLSLSCRLPACQGP